MENRIGISSRALWSLPLLGKEEQPSGGLHLPVHLKLRFMSVSAMGKGGFHSGIHLPCVTLRRCQTFHGIPEIPAPAPLAAPQLPQPQVPHRASCLCPETPDNWLGARQQGLGLPFSWSSWTNLLEPPEAAWDLTSAVSGVLCLQPCLAQGSD